MPVQKKILIVEDDPGIVTVLRDRLKSYGYEVHSVQSGAAALQAVADTAPDCMLLDLELPGMSGFEVLEQINKARIDLPVIIVTASSSKISAKKALDMGAVSYILKPFDAETLQNEVAKALETRMHNNQ